VRWDAPEFLAEAVAWIRAESPAAVTGSIEQTHLPPWATVLRVPTAVGVLWFKANAQIHVFEAGLTQRLVETLPERVVELVAADPARGWMLMRDAGTRLREVDSSTGQLRHWELILPLYAEVQRELAASADELLGLGVPDHRLRRLPELLEEVLAHSEVLLVGQQDGVTALELERLRGARPELVALCSELRAVGIPETIQHDDLHDGQVFVRGGHYRLLDWGDSCVSHPFHTMVVTLRAFAYKHRLEPGGPEVRRLRDAYLEPFGSGLERAFELAYRTGTLARALAWYRYVAGTGLEYADSIPYGLKMFLADGPIGSWEPD
jgi:Phosphotransferase enzyme family